MKIKMRKKFGFLRKIKNENFDMEDFDREVIKHVNEIKGNLRILWYITSFQYRHDYFIILQVKKISENKVKVLVIGMIKDYGRRDDIEIRI